MFVAGWMVSLRALVSGGSCVCFLARERIVSRSQEESDLVRIETSVIPNVVDWVRH